MTLKLRLLRDIDAHGPITVADYMTRCLFDPKDGYYAQHPKLGAEGDFLTAPTIGQLFGEAIGVWIDWVYVRLGRPERFTLVEIGGGDGALMSDALRVLSRSPAGAAARVVMIEPSAPLKALQQQKLGEEIPFAQSLADISVEHPVVLIANEVLDCLPIHQFVKREQDWAERYIGLNENGELSFTLGPAPAGFVAPCEAEPGQVVEISPAQEALVDDICHLLKTAHGAALLIDYGRAAPEPGDTLQALKAHQKIDPLSAPGECDLTAWADFPRLLDTAEAAGLQTELTPQSTFLRPLGVEARAAHLARANPDRADFIQRQLDRLIAPEQMGELFKVLAIYAPPPPSN